jgi:IS30 family transposase
VGTLVERTTLFTVLAKMKEDCAISAIKGFSHLLNRIEAQKRLSTTYDQGKVMVGHQQLTAEASIAAYFADPHSPWQRGINENTSGLVRQYLPKGSGPSVFSQEEPDAIAWKLNTRPHSHLGSNARRNCLHRTRMTLSQHHAALFAPGA